MSSVTSSFESFGSTQKRLIYRGLLALVKSNSGFGFCNNDQGHPAYLIGRNGTINHAQYGDSPERNQLFQMMHTLSVELNAAAIDNSAEISEYIFSWSDFCLLATSAYHQGK